MITAKDNPRIKRIRALQSDRKTRQAEMAFVVEGVRLVEEALGSGWPVEWLIYTEDLSERGLALLRQAGERAIPADLVSPAVLASISDTQTPAGILAVLSRQELPLPEKPDFVFILDGLRDPGNLGTVLRTANAAGVQVVLLPPGAVDPFSPKVLRSAMGAHFHLPVHSLGWLEISAYCRQHGLATYLADSGRGLAHTQADLRSPLALILGGEAAGAGAEAAQLARQRLQIPMPGQAESLNAAVAAAILLFEVVRQRQAVPKE